MRERQRILIVDDEQAIRRFLEVTLTSQGYDLVEAAKGSDALTLAATSKPDVILLDIGLPDMPGTEVVSRIREWSKVPVIILSVRGAESDKIAALDAGADDYLTKPFGAGELLARIRVALRRSAVPAGEPIVTSGELTVDLARRMVSVGGKEIQLTPNEFDIMRVLAINAGKVLTHRQLLREVWGAVYENEFHIIHVNISNLRRKLEPEPARPRFILTEPGVGYRLKTQQ